MAKRRREEGSAEDEDAATPRKTRRAPKEDSAESSPQAPVAETPAGRKSILRGTPSRLNGTTNIEETPKSLRKVLFDSPRHASGKAAQNTTPSVSRNDRSARRKSQRVLQNIDDVSEDEGLARDEVIAKQILGDDEDSEEDDDEDITVAEPSSAPDTPSKSGKLRGRPKGRRRERTPSPPPDLPPHELYFFQNRAGGNKTSANALPSHLLLNHDDYFAKINAYKDSHADDIERLERLHQRGFDQWLFELEEGFNLCLYGYGSKRRLVMDFADHLYVCAEGKKPKIVVVNGYSPGLTIKDILSTIASVALTKNTKLPAQPAAMLDLIISTLKDIPPSTRLTIIVHSLDHANLRKASNQMIIARLAAHPSISLLATCDTPNFPLLWDLSVTRQFRFLYHDCTTFQPYHVELDVVEEVNSLLGRSRRRLGGKDGVTFVLKSLPENARSLFRILVAEQLALADIHKDYSAVSEDVEMSEEDILGASDEEAAAAEQNTPSRRGRGRPARARQVPRPVARSAVAVVEGVEYRTLYHKAVEEFVCSSELSFRTLLKEFHDHQMVESRKDGAGTERLSVPMGREELESLLEELV
jgi:origin recognition complex subunit 2